MYVQKIKNALAEDVPDFQTSQTFVIVVLQLEKKEYLSMAVKWQADVIKSLSGAIIPD